MLVPLYLAADRPDRYVSRVHNQVEPALQQVVNVRITNSDGALQALAQQLDDRPPGARVTAMQFQVENLVAFSIRELKIIVQGLGRSLEA